jgi:hypothetical protein
MAVLLQHFAQDRTLADSTRARFAPPRRVLSSRPWISLDQSAIKERSGEYQIARVGDLEIELIIRHEKHSRAQMLDRRNLIRDRKFFCRHGLVSLDEKIASKDLRSLHGIKPCAIHATTNKTILVRSL